MSRREHLIVTCGLCQGYYDMDFEEGWDNDHDARNTMFGICHAKDEDWKVEVISCDDWADCNCAPPSKGLRADFPDLSELLK